MEICGFCYLNKDITWIHTTFYNFFIVPSKEIAIANYVAIIKSETEGNKIKQTERRKKHSRGECHVCAFLRKFGRFLCIRI